MSLLGLVLLCVTPFMLAGFRATRGLPGWARLAGTSTPAALLVGSAITLIGLELCKEADTLTPSQEATCKTTSSLAIPVTTAYFAIVALTWLFALVTNRASGTRTAALGTAGIVALIPPALAVGLWAYVQL